ncbi:MAG: SpoVA/SpoVAEb family sporulation membrane protein [Lachnospiraceae bacterium]
MSQQKNEPKDPKQQQLEQEYAKKVKEFTPMNPLPIQMAKAFITGGLICVLGQININLCIGWGISREDAGTWCSVILVLLSVILTGLNIFPEIGKFGGAGALVPITGFANSIASAAVERQVEGQVFGIGAQIFSLAGPVILYGIFTSWVLGLVYWIMLMIGV